MPSRQRSPVPEQASPFGGLYHGFAALRTAGFGLHYVRRAFTETQDNLQLELTTSSLSTTTINKNKAFQLIQYADVAALPIASEYQSTAFVLSGTNVYTIDDVSGTNDPISATLLGAFIKRVQALYKHH